VKETNKYASKVINAKDGSTRGDKIGDHYVWKSFRYILVFVC
jgi:hypothetical protein